MEATCRKDNITPEDLGAMGMDAVCKKYAITPVDLGGAGHGSRVRGVWHQD